MSFLYTSSSSGENTQKMTCCTCLSALCISSQLTLSSFSRKSFVVSMATSVASSIG